MMKDTDKSGLAPRFKGLSLQFIITKSRIIAF